MSGNIRLRANCDADCRRQCGWQSWQHTLTCELRRELRGAVPDVMPHWQHTLTCELRPVARTNYNTCPLATYAYVRVATIVGQGHTVYGTGNIRLRASCDLISVVVGALDESLATYAYVRVATPRGGALAGYHGWQHTLTCELRPLSDRFRYQVTLRFICVWTSVQNGFSNSVSVSRRRTRTGHCSLRHFLPPCFAFEVWGFGRLGHALPL